ncbi:CLUMA_CG003740, isoform A [Clunio marinus]|uniref:CLUMA_CG003740, isoform A n=1 Tax=Clunio marinus TaxID=568069 RepID=A0A1J1HU41_9DIPT|nr:CLUMA_CG003740, isoform A [Clunio marinus]
MIEPKEVFQTLIKFAKYTGIWQMPQTSWIYRLNGPDIKTERKHIKRFTKEVRLLHGILLVCAICSAISVSLIPFFNISKHELSVRMHFPMLDYKNNDTIFITIAVLQLTIVLGAIANITLDVFPIYFMCYAIGLIEELGDRLENIGSNHAVIGHQEENDGNDLNELLKCVEVHRKIKRLVSEIEEHFSFVIMLQGLMSSLIFCATAFMLSLLSPVKDFPLFIRFGTYAITMVIQIFLPCYYGNEIATSSMKLSTRFFHCKWKKRDKKFNQAMIFFMENTKRTINIRAFELVDLNIETFNGISKFAYSLFALVSRVNNRE